MVEGMVAPGFEGVQAAFTANFVEHGEVGAAVCLYRHGQPIVDLWGGHADAGGERRWERDTIVGTFSVTKGITAICAHLLVQRGQLDVDAPVAAYWPEFGANGKARIPVRWVLSHQAGLAAVDGDLTMDDVLGWDGVVAAIAAQAPNWEPGAAHGYHVRSYGWIMGEIVRRITGVSIGRFFRTEIAEPLGLNYWIGVPSAVQTSCAELIPTDTPREVPEGVDLELLVRATLGPNNLFAGGYDSTWNRSDIRTAEMPSSNGTGDARSLARLYAACLGPVDGHRVLDARTVERATVRQCKGNDCVLGRPLSFALGFALQPTYPGAGRQVFGHSGAGGSTAFADPEQGLAFAYVMNQLRFPPLGEMDMRSYNLVKATYDALA